MWYKDERNGSHTYFADSKDLYNWEVKDCAADDVPHEGANVFGFGGKYWLITDCWSGLDVYYSDDLTTWTKQSSRILDIGGTREDDGVIANHADVYVTDNNAYIFYFTHPDRQKNMLENNIGNERRTSIQVAELEVKDGVLVCDRNKDISVKLR